MVYIYSAQIKKKIGLNQELFYLEKLNFRNEEETRDSYIKWSWVDESSPRPVYKKKLKFFCFEWNTQFINYKNFLKILNKLKVSI